MGAKIVTNLKDIHNSMGLEIHIHEYSKEECEPFRECNCNCRCRCPTECCQTEYIVRDCRHHEPKTLGYTREMVKDMRDHGVSGVKTSQKHHCSYNCVIYWKEVLESIEDEEDLPKKPLCCKRCSDEIISDETTAKFHCEQSKKEAFRDCDWLCVENWKKVVEMSRGMDDDCWVCTE
jgi:hypothetical protein